MFLKAIRLFATLSVCFLVDSNGAAINSPTDKELFVTNRLESGVPMPAQSEWFGCSDKIYAALKVNGLSQGKHLLENEWRNPKGKLQERTHQEFNSYGGLNTVWGWLKLHQPPQAAVERLLFQDESAGMLGFVGEWHVKFLLDGEVVGSKEFRVMC